MRSMPAWPVQLGGVAVWVGGVVAPTALPLPVAVAVRVVGGSGDSAHCNWLSAGHVRTGAPESMTVIVFWHVLAQPLALVMVRLSVNELELVPATALTVRLVLAPLMVPLPAIDQRYDVILAGA